MKASVYIIIGSDSDLPVMSEATKLLEEFAVPYNIQILSAHRSPHELRRFLEKINTKNPFVIIAAAGGAAHLPGVIAAHVVRPVIGVPIKTPTLAGVDSLYSIVQMPPGVPVATVGINAAQNAALLAIQMLSMIDFSLYKKVEQYKHDLAQGVVKKNTKLKKIGTQNYLDDKSQHASR